MTDYCSIPPDHIFESAEAAPLDGCRLHAIREDGFNRKPFSTAARLFFVVPLGISLISCSYTQPPLWLKVKVYFPFNLYPFTAYFYMQRYSKEHYMQLKQDVSRIEIKKHDLLLPKALWESYGDML